MTSLRVFVHPAPAPSAFVDACFAEVQARSLLITTAGSPEDADLALAPSLRRVLARAEWSAPRLGTLVFHPSLLPLRRGPDAVRWAATSGDAVTGATWFWCDEGLDEGPICEQELVHVPAGITPRRLYEAVIAPAGVRCLSRALDALTAGFVRTVPQDAAASTYQSWAPRASRG